MHGFIAKNAPKSEPLCGMSGKDVVLPDVVGTVAVGIAEVDGVALGRVEPESILLARHLNRRPVHIGDAVETEPILIAGNADGGMLRRTAFFDRHEGVEQLVGVPRHVQAAVKDHERTPGRRVRQAIVMSQDGKGGIIDALGANVDQQVVIARDQNVAIHQGARHIPHRMPAGSFEENAHMRPTLHRAVPKLGVFPREDNTPFKDAPIARDPMPVQIQDRSIAYRDAAGEEVAGQIVLQLQYPAWAKDVAAGDVMGLRGGHTAQGKPQHPQERGDSTSSRPVFPQVLLHCICPFRMP